MTPARLAFASTLLLLAIVNGALLAEEKAAQPSVNLRETLDKGDRLMQRGDYEAARREFERALEADRGSVPAWRGLGWSLWRLGRKEEAYKTWNDLLKVLPREKSVMLAIAQAQEQDNLWDKALDSYERVLQADPKNDSAREARARILRYLGDVKIKKSASPSEAIALYEKSLQERPDHRGTIRALASLYQDEHRYKEAIALLRGYLTAHADDDEIREKLANAASSAGEYDEAAKQWGALIKRHPDDPKYTIQLARLLQRAGKAEDAIQVAKEILQRHPDNADALDILTDAALYGGQEEQALQWLEHYAKVQPSPVRLNQLGELHLARGRKLDDLDDDRGAKMEYEAAVRAFKRSGEIDPLSADARLGYITSLRLAGQIDQAIAEAERLHKEYPSLERATRELYDANLQAGRYDRAAVYYAELRKNFPQSLRLQREGAFLTFAQGQKDEAIASLQNLLQKDLRPNIPVLLYHGITTSTLENATPVENFRSQMGALKKAGYQTITVADLKSFLQGKASLPAKPVVITFDDARADSFRNADPILQAAGYRAAMFIPTAEIDRKIAFYAPWETIREMSRNGRWEFQCHGNFAHRLIPIDAEGHKGRFLANRMWKQDAGRLESREEFIQRLDQDYAGCKAELTREVPGSQVIGYAYPFDDPGWKTLNNEPDAFRINQELLARHYDLGFLVEPPGFVTRTMPPALLPRFEVPREFNGTELMRHLRTQEPHISVLLRIAQFQAYGGDYAAALQTYDLLARDDADPAAVAEGRGTVLAWQGDSAGAREMLALAHRLRPDDPVLEARTSALELRFRPLARMSVNGYSDNRDRSSIRFGPSGEVHLGDRFTLAPSYEHMEFEHRNFDASKLPGEAPAGPSPQPTPEPTPADGGPSGTTVAAQTESPAPGERLKLRAVGDQFQMQVNYDWDWHSGLSLSGGVASFRNESSPRVFGNDETFALGSGQLSLGLGDNVDLSLGGSRDFVGTAGAIVDGLGVSSSLARLRVRPFDPVILMGQHSFSRYDDDNTRNTAIGQVLFQLFKEPTVLAGYQFVFDDTKRESELFYAPQEFIANEGVFSLTARPHKRLRFNASLSVGVGQERGGNPEVEASASGGGELTLGDHFGLFGHVGRSQAARFESIEGGGGFLVRF